MSPINPNIKIPGELKGAAFMAPEPSGIPTDAEVASLIRATYDGCAEAAHQDADNLLLGLMEKLNYPETARAFREMRFPYC